MGRNLNLTAMVWCLLLSGQLQTSPLSEKQAVTSAQRIPASELDAELPSRPFVDWFRQLVGPQAGVNWQLNECGEQPSLLLAQGRDLPACAEVNALLPDNRKVVVMIEVGTFKKGLTRQPRFYHAAIEQQGELYRVRRLRDLPEGLREPATLAEGNAIKLTPLNSPLLRLAPGVNGGKPPVDVSADAPPPPAPPRETRKVSESVLLGNVITRVQPLYPTSARKMNVSGKVEVLITISEAGRVLEAKVINGHPLMHRAAEDAARQWVFKPTTLNGMPVKVESVLTFVFTPTR